MLHHEPYLILKFLSNELLGAKINEYKFNHILNWILCKYSILCCVLYNFLIFVTSYWAQKLKSLDSKSYIYIYIYTHTYIWVTIKLHLM